MNYDFLNMLNCFCFNTVVFSLINIPIRRQRLGWFVGIFAVKPSCFRLTKTQLAVRRSGPHLSNNYCVLAHCMAILL